MAAFDPEERQVYDGDTVPVALYGHAKHPVDRALSWLGHYARQFPNYVSAPKRAKALRAGPVAALRRERTDLSGFAWVLLERGYLTAKEHMTLVQQSRQRRNGMMTVLVNLPSGTFTFSKGKEGGEWTFTITPASIQALWRQVVATGNPHVVAAVQAGIDASGGATLEPGMGCPKAMLPALDHPEGGKMVCDWIDERLAGISRWRPSPFCGSGRASLADVAVAAAHKGHIDAALKAWNAFATVPLATWSRPCKYSHWNREALVRPHKQLHLPQVLAEMALAPFPGVQPVLEAAWEHVQSQDGAAWVSHSHQYAHFHDWEGVIIRIGLQRACEQGKSGGVAWWLSKTPPSQLCPPLPPQGHAFLTACIDGIVSCHSSACFRALVHHRPAVDLSQASLVLADCGWGGYGGYSRAAMLRDLLWDDRPANTTFDVLAMLKARMHTAPVCVPPRAPASLKLMLKRCLETRGMAAVLGVIDLEKNILPIVLNEQWGSRRRLVLHRRRSRARRRGKG